MVLTLGSRVQPYENAPGPAEVVHVTPQLDYQADTHLHRDR